MWETGHSEMRMIEEYRSKGLLPPNFEVLCDEADQFSIIYENKDGEPVIMGVNRESFDFWRNKSEHKSTI